MKEISIVILIVALLGCEYKSQHPQGVFSVKASKEDSIDARKLLHEIAIENNLTFEDASHKYPSGNSTVIAVAERADGLQLILLGDPEVGNLSVAVHCHEKCTEWQSIYKTAKNRFSKQWAVSE